MKTKIFIAVFLYLAINVSAQSDNIISVKNIKGQAIGGINTAPAEIIEKAIKNAKLNALTKAGIHEQINTYQNLYRSETSQDYEEIFMSDVFTNISGVVQSVTIKDTVARFDESNYALKVTITADAKVIKYDKKEDRTFDAWVEGIKNYYNSPSPATFKIKPTEDCYAQIFLIAREQESYQLYPNQYEKQQLLKAHKEHSFPTVPYIDYELSTKLKQEPHRLIIVLLKEAIPFTGKVAYKPILDWIFSISPEKRVVKSFGITVIKN
ncbi:MAG TPA: DUF4384 domain-containing protein [Salinivirga sp.]|uniref:DUF4384 domain-containing protein n=1 Tax=Salinivirga sp. TaxID=1970192 RepID=UPI002B45FF41|nr:DUF4384 domain-containing protein [Salinivirga sp.]HKK58912.1 DUF4384 domain-containing protein [Salinivirga sp.]